MSKVKSKQKERTKKRVSLRRKVKDLENNFSMLGLMLERMNNQVIGLSNAFMVHGMASQFLAKIYSEANNISLSEFYKRAKDLNNQLVKEMKKKKEEEEKKLKKAKENKEEIVDEQEGKKSESKESVAQAGVEERENSKSDIDFPQKKKIQSLNKNS